MNIRSRGARLLVSAGVALTLAVGTITVAGSAYGASPAAVGLGTADSFAVLAGAGITNTGPTTINGDVGSFPTTTQSGFGSVTLTGTNHAGDSVTQGAKTDLTTAYNDAAGRGPTIPVTADLGGQNLVAGVYNSASSLALTGVLTLTGSASDVWVFQAGSTLTTASGSSVVFIGGAQACNVFWQVGSSATIGTGSAFKGTILALTSITVTTGATVDGRVLARNGAVTLDTNTITRSTCAVAPTPAPTAVPTAVPTFGPTPGPSATPSATPAPSATPSAAPTSAATATPTPRIPSLPSTATLEDGTLLYLILPILVIIFLALYLVARARRRRAPPAA